MKNQGGVSASSCSAPPGGVLQLRALEEGAPATQGPAGSMLAHVLAVLRPGWPCRWPHCGLDLRFTVPPHRGCLAEPQFCGLRRAGWGLCGPAGREVSVSRSVSPNSSCQLSVLHGSLLVTSRRLGCHSGSLAGLPGFPSCFTRLLSPAVHTTWSKVLPLCWSAASGRSQSQIVEGKNP